MRGLTSKNQEKRSFGVLSIRVRLVWIRVCQSIRRAVDTLEMGRVLVSLILGAIAFLISILICVMTSIEARTGFVGGGVALTTVLGLSLITCCLWSDQTLQTHRSNWERELPRAIAARKERRASERLTPLPVRLAPTSSHPVNDEVQFEIVKPEPLLKPTVTTNTSEVDSINVFLSFLTSDSTVDSRLSSETACSSNADNFNLCVDGNCVPFIGKARAYRIIIRNNTATIMRLDLDNSPPLAISRATASSVISIGWRAIKLRLPNEGKFKLTLKEPDSHIKMAMLRAWIKGLRGKRYIEDARNWLIRRNLSVAAAMGTLQLLATWTVLKSASRLGTSSLTHSEIEQTAQFLFEATFACGIIGCVCGQRWGAIILASFNALNALTMGQSILHAIGQENATLATALCIPLCISIGWTWWYWNWFSKAGHACRICTAPK